MTRLGVIRQRLAPPQSREHPLEGAPQRRRIHFVQPLARLTPHKLRRFERTRSSLRASRSNRDSDEYFSPNSASADIKQSGKVRPRPATESGTRSKQPRTMRSKPGALSVLRNSDWVVVRHLGTKTACMSLFSAESPRRKIFATAGNPRNQWRGGISGNCCRARSCGLGLCGGVREQRPARCRSSGARVANHTRGDATENDRDQPRQALDGSYPEIGIAL